MLFVFLSLLIIPISINLKEEPIKWIPIGIIALINMELIYHIFINDHSIGKFYVLEEKFIAVLISIVSSICSSSIGILIDNLEKVEGWFVEMLPEILSFFKFILIGIVIIGLVLLLIKWNYKIAIKKLGKGKVK